MQPALAWINKMEFGGNIEQCRHPGHSSSIYVSFVSKCGIMGYCVPSIAHITFGNLAVKNKSTLILSRRLWETNVLFLSACHFLKYPRQHKTERDISAACATVCWKDPKAKRWGVSKSLANAGMSWLLVGSDFKSNQGCMTWQRVPTFHLIIYLKQGEWNTTSLRTWDTFLLQKFELLPNSSDVHLQ